MRARTVRNLDTSLSLFILEMDSEILFSGDVGIPGRARDDVFRV